MIFTLSRCGPSQTHADMSIGGSLTRCEPGMTRSEPLSGANAEMRYIADSVCHAPCPTFRKIGMQALAAIARHGCPQEQAGHVPVRSSTAVAASAGSVWLITQRSRVQILPPLPGKTLPGRHLPGAFFSCRWW